MVTIDEESSDDENVGEWEVGVLLYPQGRTTVCVRMSPAWCRHTALQRYLCYISSVHAVSRGGATAQQVLVKNKYLIVHLNSDF